MLFSSSSFSLFYMRWRRQQIRGQAGRGGRAWRRWVAAQGGGGWPGRAAAGPGSERRPCRARPAVDDGARPVAWRDKGGEEDGGPDSGTRAPSRPTCSQRRRRQPATAAAGRRDLPEVGYTSPSYSRLRVTLYSAPRAHHGRFPTPA